MGVRHTFGYGCRADCVGGIMFAKGDVVRINPELKGIGVVSAMCRWCGSVQVIMEVSGQHATLVKTPCRWDVCDLSPINAYKGDD